MFFLPRYITRVLMLCIEREQKSQRTRLARCNPGLLFQAETVEIIVLPRPRHDLDFRLNDGRIQTHSAD